jgi:hypothetical protein
MPLVHPPRLPLAGRGVGALPGGVGVGLLVVEMEMGMRMAREMGLLDVDGELGIDSDTDIHILLDSDIAIALSAFHRTEPVRDQAIHGIVIPFKAGRDDLLRELAA